MAYKMGLPVHQFIAATNANDTVPRFLESGIYETRASVQTYSNAMDVGAPSNWVRIMDLFNDDVEALKAIVSSSAYSDAETQEAIAEIYTRYDYVACPHTAIAYRALSNYLSLYKDDGLTGVFLSTAHPCKFPDVFPEEIAAAIETPDQVSELRSKTSTAQEMEAVYADFKAYLQAAR